MSKSVIYRHPDVRTTKRGDIFLSSIPSVLAHPIKTAQKAWTNSNVYMTHGGVLVNYNTTFEALWTYKHQDFFQAYGGTTVFIARPKYADSKTVDRGINYIESLKKGKVYPVLKLVSHVLPPLTKLFPKQMVCTELAACYGVQIEALPFYNGMSPDKLHNILCNHWAWDIIYWGEL